MITSVHFPESGIASLLSVIDAHSSIEVGIVGTERMVGLPLFLGVKTSFNRTVVQGEGFAMKMTAPDFVRECQTKAEVFSVLRRFTYSRMKQISQSAVCNRFHSIDGQLARWLLMTRDRINANEFKITQEFLAYMGRFKERRPIRYVRGSIAILDMPSLVTLAFKCH